MGRTLAIRRLPLASALTQRQLLEAPAQRPRFCERMADAGLHPLHATGISVLQVNVGKFCNQTCRHCHVDAGPDRTEQMSADTAEACIRVLDVAGIATLDITGGAPELNPSFRHLVRAARALGRHVMDRCNLTILTLGPQQDLAEFLAVHQVEVVASLPYFQPDQADAQRGEGVFEKSIDGLRKLNGLGYGHPGSGLVLNLVHNPVGAFLPAAQDSLEARFRRELDNRHGVVFNRLFTITNMPVSRFLEFLLDSGNYAGYMDRLASAFNPAAAHAVMCRSTLSVAWDGTLHDCDFNQMLDLPVTQGLPRHIRDFDLASLAGRPIVTGNHCYGCTAGKGSSCGGATVREAVTGPRVLPAAAWPPLITDHRPHHQRSAHQLNAVERFAKEHPGDPRHGHRLEVEHEGRARGSYARQQQEQRHDARRIAQAQPQQARQGRTRPRPPEAIREQRRPAEDDRRRPHGEAGAHGGVQVGRPAGREHQGRGEGGRGAQCRRDAPAVDRLRRYAQNQHQPGESHRQRYTEARCETLRAQRRLGQAGEEGVGVEQQDGQRHGQARHRHLHQHRLGGDGQAQQHHGPCAARQRHECHAAQTQQPQDQGGGAQAAHRGGGEHAHAAGEGKPRHHVAGAQGECHAQQTGQGTPGRGRAAQGSASSSTGTAALRRLSG